MLDEVCPDEYRYTGDGSFAIGGMVPDFTNCDGQKKLIEMFGTYWHSQEVTGKPEEQEEQDRKDKYAEFGFKCLVVWEHELPNRNLVVQRLKAFNKSEREV